MEESKKQNIELDNTLKEENIQRNFDKSAYNDIKNNGLNEMMKQIKCKINDKKYSTEISNLKDENKKLKEENKNLIEICINLKEENKQNKTELDITKKKVQILLDIINNQKMI